MKRVAFSSIVAGVVLLSTSAAFAVNCSQVRKYAKTGRSVEDIAQTMIVDEAEVKKCLEGEAGDAAPTPPATDAKTK